MLAQEDAHTTASSGPPAAMDVGQAPSLAVDNAQSYKIPRNKQPSSASDLKAAAGASASLPGPDHRDTPVQASGSSFAQRKVHRTRPAKSMSTLVEGNTMMRSIDRPPPGDPLGRHDSKATPDAQKRRSTYFQNEFAAVNRDPDPLKTRVHNEAIVLAELKTNVIINDEFTFITDLSYHLSNRYQRPISSIVITLNHGQCMMFGGSFDPAYTLTIHALPSLTRPTTNKRNAALVQKHMEETLGVKSSRGYIRFVATPEENVAIGGKTVAAEMEELGVGQEIAVPTRSKSKTNRRISVRSFASLKTPSTADLQKSMLTPPPSASEEGFSIPTIPEVPPTPPEEEKVLELVMDKPKKHSNRRKSLRFTLFGAKPAPPVPTEKRPRTVGS